MRRLQLPPHQTPRDLQPLQHRLPVQLVKIKAVFKPTRKCDVCSSLLTKPCSRCKNTFYCSAECQKSAWKKHKKTCKAPTSPPATEADLRTLHKGIALLNMCIQRSGAGDGPTSVVLEFLVVI